MADSVFITPQGGTVQGNIIVTGQGLFADGTAAAPSIGFSSSASTGIYSQGTTEVRITNAGALGYQFKATGLQIADTASSLQFGTNGDTVLARSAAGSFAFKDAASATKSVALVLPTGLTNVVPVVTSDPATRKVGATSAQTIGSFTVGAADATFRVSANILVTTATTHSFTVTCAYTDEGNTARTLTLNFSTLAGVISNTAIGNAAGAVPYNGVVQHIRCKAATTITIATTGTFTTVVYNGEGIIEKVT